MTDEPTRKEIIEALVDVLDGNSAPWDIQYNTGLSQERCEEIERISQEATAKALLVYEEKRQQRKAEKKARLEEQKKQEEMNKTINLAMVGGMIDFGGGYRKKKNSIFG